MLFALALSVLLGLSAALCLGQVLEPGQLREVGRRIRLRQFTIRQMMVAVVVTGLLFHLFTARGPEGEGSFYLLCLGVLVWFVRIWRGEFVFLMGLGDDEFPGRHDKIIWVIMLSAFAPIGVWFFRAYRLVHWPEPATSVEPEAGAEPQPA